MILLTSSKTIGLILVSGQSATKLSQLSMKICLIVNSDNKNHQEKYITNYEKSQIKEPKLNQALKGRNLFRFFIVK